MPASLVGKGVDTLAQIAWNCETGARGVHEAGSVAGAHMGPRRWDAVGNSARL